MLLRSHSWSETSATFLEWNPQSSWKAAQPLRNFIEKGIDKITFGDIADASTIRAVARISFTQSVRQALHPGSPGKANTHHGVLFNKGADVLLLFFLVFFRSNARYREKSIKWSQSNTRNWMNNLNRMLLRNQCIILDWDFMSGLKNTSQVTFLRLH